MPAINTNFSLHISAGLANGHKIVGQNSISHPSAPTSLSSFSEREETSHHDRIEDATLPGSLPSLRKQYISFSKADEEELPARIERIWYINPYGQEIRPPVNPKVVEAVSNAQTIIYSIGSLYTSIIPNLILADVGDALASPSIANKILVLNSTLDRETGPKSHPYTATDFVAAIAKACHYSRGLDEQPLENDYKLYVTHVIHLEGPETPVVDRKQLNELGIETIRLYGRKIDPMKSVVRYDDKALLQALQATIGSREGRQDRSRRNTMDNFG